MTPVAPGFASAQNFEFLGQKRTSKIRHQESGRKKAAPGLNSPGDPFTVTCHSLELPPEAMFLLARRTKACLNIAGVALARA